MAQIGPQIPHGVHIDQTTDSLAALASQYGMPAAQLPLRPGMPPCRFYLRTGECKYADTCKFDHPVDRQTHLGAPLQQPGQPTCQHYMRTGTCKFGSTCKFDHPLDREAVAAQSAQLSLAAGGGGFPVRPGMGDCRFYMQTGSCRFGATCKFNHPPSRVGGQDMGMGMDPMMMQANGGQQQQWQGQQAASPAVTGILLTQQRAQAQSYLEHPAAAAYGGAYYQDPHATNGHAGYEKRDREGGAAAVDPYKRQRVGEAGAGQQGASHQKPSAAMYPQQQQQQQHQPQATQQPQQQQQQPSYDYGAPLNQQPEQRYEPQQQQQHMQQAYSPQAAWGGAPPQQEPHWQPQHPQHHQPMLLQPRRMMMPPPHEMRHPHPHHPHHQRQHPQGPHFGGRQQMIMGPGAQQPPLRPGAPNCRHFMKTRMCGFGMGCRFNHPLPEREGQPDCSFYMKTSKCKFGESCKFNHPPNVHNDLSKGPAGGHGGAPLPSRPGQSACKFYMKTGSCSYGPSCKYDHPQLAPQPEVTAGAAATDGDATAAAQVAGAETSAATTGSLAAPVDAVSA